MSKTDSRFVEALDALGVAKTIVDSIYPIGTPSEARGKIASAAKELVDAGNVSTCDVEWCDSTEWLHQEHTHRDTITGHSGVEHLEIGAAVDPKGTRDDEIVFRAWFSEGQEYDSVVVELTVDQAREAITLIELAISRREELRGALQ